MVRRLLLPLALAAGGIATAQVQSPDVEMANLREDVRGLSQRVGDLSLRVEQLESEIAALKGRDDANRDAATVSQLNAAVAELNRTVEAAVAASKDETLRQVAEQMEKLARQTNAALASISRKGGDAAVPEAFSQNFPKEGITYTVQKGDSVGSIARKTGAKAKDIIDANKIADPSKIMVGQALFVPGGK